ncbi:hypothetical protein CsSME_00015958 [Camellia sinensis var. sinensis]|uniref:Uncharacterized protein n=1 Tax=Camellia sinensis TaxID=4442 RepID=A0A7J7HTE1_CAMSI|nr:hypothetical protein HYC85_008956 [Camellia sinensis]
MILCRFIAKTHEFLSPKQKHCTNEVRVEYEEFKTNVMGLFLPVHVGTVILIRKPMPEADTFQLAFILSHTKEFAKALADTIQMAFPKAKLVLVVAMASDKDHLGFSRELFSDWFLITFGSILANQDQLLNFFS